MVTKTNSISLSPEELMVEQGYIPETIVVEEFELFANWDDVLCPICLEFPHNSVLLQCSSYDKGCRPFVCDTDHFHSNCLHRFKQANEISSVSKTPDSAENLQSTGRGVAESKPACPLCRGEVTGWVVVDKARVHLDEKKRSCEEEKCKFSGNYLELRNHVQVEHPHSCPSKIDPARLLDWENFQQSSEIIDVLSTINSEVPGGVVLGDYVIEYGDDNSGEEFEDFPGDEGNWWTSCMLYQVFDNFRTSRNRRRSRRNNNRQLSYDHASNSDEGSVSSVENIDYRAEDDDEFVNARELSRGTAGQRSYRRRRTRFHDN